MGTALITIRIMPDSPDSDLNEIETSAKKIIEEEKGDNLNVQKEPVAFGLNAINISFARDENLDSDEMLKKIQDLPAVSSAEITDFRRAFG